MKRSRILTASLVLIVFLAVLADSGLGGEEKAKRGPQRWEPNIARFEQQDREDPPEKGGILFVGSSSIVRWDVAKWFPDMPVLNRGFGGSQIADSVHFAERIVIPYRPRTIVFYAGDNDLAAGKAPEQVLADFKAFVSKVRASLPEAKIIYVGIKPSIKRWSLIEPVRKANGLIREAISSDARSIFVDVDSPMIGTGGMPRKELYIADGLHLSDEGYAVWTKLLAPHLAR
ncbi:MAG: SGNH/GDSL hydrolase family protein [Thermoguttaceae bacterium]|nr:SGNH/GDSL hydrolase family protein [Thermoguttaceae bacterium]MDI9443013.1 SGNH/GDSL hydrolase family protein [Planctomycetota bacterium]